MRMYAGAGLLVVTLAVAFSFARKEESLEQLIARANSAQPDQQSALYMEVADRLLKSAIESEKAGQRDPFLNSLREIVKYCDNAHSSAMHANKHLKRTEIKIRRIASRLRDIKLDADADDQSEVQNAIDRLEGFRTELLHSMFGSGSND